MEKKTTSWRTIGILLLGIPIGYVLTASGDGNLEALGEILKAIGWLTFLFAIAKGITQIFKKK